jgi:thioredoxin reductase (NADPH)
MTVVESPSYLTLALNNGQQVRAHFLFMCNGLTPATKWLPSSIKRDQDGRVLTKLPSLQTDLQNVYAIGDCRAGSTPRVGIAIGDGSAVVSEIWQRFVKDRACSRCEEILQ